MFPSWHCAYRGSLVFLQKASVREALLQTVHLAYPKMLTFLFSFYLAVASVTICLRSPEGIIAEPEPVMYYCGAAGILCDLMEMVQDCGKCGVFIFLSPHERNAPQAWSLDVQSISFSLSITLLKC